MSDSVQALKLIHAVEAADSSATLFQAVRELSAAKLEAGIPTLIESLGFNNPGVAIAAVSGLVNLGKPAVQPLLDQLDGYNYGARAWAIRALAQIGDPRGLNMLLDAVRGDFAMSVRRAAAKGLGFLQWEDLPEEQVDAAQAQVLDALTQATQDHEWIVRYAAVVGLQALAVSVVETHPDWRSQILTHLSDRLHQDDSPTLQARIQLAQQILTQEPTTAPHWQATLDQLYTRKQGERPIKEGDPRKFRDAAVAIANPPLTADHLVD